MTYGMEVESFIAIETGPMYNLAVYNRGNSTHKKDCTKIRHTNLLSLHYQYFDYFNNP